MPAQAIANFYGLIQEQCKQIEMANQKVRDLIASHSDGPDTPTHLMFIHLSDDYSLRGAWLFEWSWLSANERFVEKTVHKQPRGFYFELKEEQDKPFQKFPLSSVTVLAGS